MSVGTDISELVLPDTLEAYVTVETEDDKSLTMGSRNKDDDEESDDSDKNKGDHDISMFIRVGSGDWNAVTETKEPIEVIIGIPADGQGGRKP